MEVVHDMNLEVHYGSFVVRDPIWPKLSDEAPVLLVRTTSPCTLQKIELHIGTWSSTLAKEPWTAVMPRDALLSAGGVSVWATDACDHGGGKSSVP